MPCAEPSVSRAAARRATRKRNERITCPPPAFQPFRGCGRLYHGSAGADRSVRARWERSDPVHVVVYTAWMAGLGVTLTPPPTMKFRTYAPDFHGSVLRDPRPAPPHGSPERRI